MGQKRILVYTESYLPSLGGLENNTLLLCESLSEMGYAVSLLTPQKNAQLHNSFRVIESRNTFLYFNIIQKHQLIIINGGVSFKAAIPSLILAKPYWIIYQMASLYRDLEGSDQLKHLKNKLRLALAKKATLNIGVSDYSYQELSKDFGEAHTSLLTNPAAAIFENQQLNKKLQSPFHCLFAGRLIEGKGIRLLVKAIIDLCEEGYPISLNIVGDGPERNFLMENPHSSIVYKGPQPPERLIEVYHQSHLTVIPSTSHTEGSPLTMAESLLCGTPVLVSNQRAMALSVQHEDLIFKSGDLIDLKKKLINLMQCSNYELLREHCRNIASDFSHSHYLSKLKKLLITKHV